MLKDGVLLLKRKSGSGYQKHVRKGKKDGNWEDKPNRELKYQISVDWKEEEEEEHWKGRPHSQKK